MMMTMTIKMMTVMACLQITTMTKSHHDDDDDDDGNIWIRVGSVVSLSSAQRET